MRRGDPELDWWCGLWLCLLLLCAVPAQAGASSFVLQSLPGDASPADVLAGHHDHELGPPLAEPLIRGRRGETRWWRVITPEPRTAEDSPKLVLRSPFLARVQAWAPGKAAPARYALYGDDADPRHSHRALFVDLPQGIPAGSALWLRIDPGSRVAMQVSIEPLDQVRRDDLAYVAWRVFVLSVLSVLALLAFAFGIGTGEASFGWFGAMLCFAVLYTMSLGGDLRLVPWAEAVFGTTPQSSRIVGGLGVVCSNLFQRAYLGLPRKLRWAERALWFGSGLAMVTVVGSVFVDAGWLGRVGNIGLVLSAIVLFLASTRLAAGGDRAGRVVMVSWLPLMVLITLAALQMAGLWAGAAWLAQGLAGSFALAGLLLTIGLADKLVQLRRDLDRASARARADELTGMFNRSGIEGELRRVMQAAQARSMPVSIAFVDLDRFKQINDEHGHRVGDECLRIASQRILNQLRGRDIIGRYGGDEFLVVMPDTRLPDALAVAGHMRAAVSSRSLATAGVDVEGTLSIGVAELVPGESMESLVERADAALYASKDAGRNRVSG